MKTILKSTLLLLCSVGLFTACSDDNDSNPTLGQPTTFVLNTPGYASMPVNLETSTELPFTWSSPDYGCPVEAEFQLEASINGSFTVSTAEAEENESLVPDYVALSVGDGCTIGGVWKGFKDLYNAGFTDKLPKIISVQSVNTCPINRAARTGEPWEPMEENTLADSISVGVPRNPDKAINAIIESGGIPVEVTDDEILEAMRVTGRECGVFGEPAGVTGMAGLSKLCREGKIPADASVVAIVTGNGLKDTANGIKAAGEPIKLEPDIEKFRAVYEELNK